MANRAFYGIIVAAFIMVAFLLTSEQVIGGEIAKQSLRLASSTTSFEGALAVKEGHGDILVRAANGHQRRLTVKQNTVITRNGEPAEYNDLRVGDEIRVKYNSEHVAIELHANGSSSSKE